MSEMLDCVFVWLSAWVCCFVDAGRRFGEGHAGCGALPDGRDGGGSGYSEVRCPSEFMILAAFLGECMQFHRQ